MSRKKEKRKEERKKERKKEGRKKERKFKTEVLERVETPFKKLERGRNETDALLN